MILSKAHLCTAPSTGKVRVNKWRHINLVNPLFYLGRFATR